MGQIVYDITEESFVKRFTTNYDLSILVGEDRFFYLVSDTKQNVLVLKGYVRDNTESNFMESGIKDVFLTDLVLRLPYRTTRIGYIGNDVTLMPEELYDASKKSTYFSNVLGKEMKDLDSDTLTSLNIRNIYAFSEGFSQVTKSYFPNAKLYHIFTALLLGFKEHAKHQDGYNLYGHVWSNKLFLVLYQKDELIFSNVYDFESAHDFLYFVMLIYNQFNLKPESDTINLSGMVIEDSEIHYNLLRYIRYVNFVPDPTFYRFGSSFRNISKHLFFDLFSLKLCE